MPDGASSSWEPAPHLAPRGVVAPRPKFRAEPATQPTMPLRIPSAPTTHYGLITPLNEHGQPMTPIIPAAPQGVMPPPTPAGDVTVDEAIHDILEDSGSMGCSPFP